MSPGVSASGRKYVQCCDPGNTVDIGNPWCEAAKAAVRSQLKFPEKIETHSNAQLRRTFVFTRVVRLCTLHVRRGGGALKQESGIQGWRLKKTAGANLCSCEQKADKQCLDVNTCKQEVENWERKWIRFCTSRRNQLQKFWVGAEAGRGCNTKTTHAPLLHPDLQRGVSCDTPGLLSSSQGPDDTPAVTKCKGAPLLSADPQKGYVVIHLISSGITVQTKTQILVWPSAEKFLLSKRRPERVQRVGGRQESGGVPPQKIPLAIFNPFCFMRGSVELATFLARTGRPKPRFFSTKS